jgi:hypothetical protein
MNYIDDPNDLKDKGFKIMYFGAFVMVVEVFYSI